MASTSSLATHLMRTAGASQAVCIAEVGRELYDELDRVGRAVDGLDESGRIWIVSTDQNRASDLVHRVRREFQVRLVHEGLAFTGGSRSPTSGHPLTREGPWTSCCPIV